MKHLDVFLWAMLAVLVSSCVFTSAVNVELLDPSETAGTTVETPFKAYLTDGRIAVFEDGARVTADSVFGAGILYSLDLAGSAAIDALAVADLVGLESVSTQILWGQSMLNSIAYFVGVPIVTSAVLLAIFGSCPTVYSFDVEGEVLEAEAFSYSIAPLLEGRDVDRIQVGADADGVVKLELRNEALETHYINHLSLLEVRHEANQAAYPNEQGQILVVGDVSEATRATDRDGSDRLEELRVKDGVAFNSSEQRIRAVTAEDFRDFIELAFPKPASDSAALVLRLRNSLLNTVLFYDLMLAAQGAEALDWLATDMANIGRAAELGLWFRETMGLEVSVLEPQGWKRVTRLADTGPLAWDEVAVQMPVPEGNELRVRLSFLADAWRIDFAGLAKEAELTEPNSASFIHVAPINRAPDPELASRIAQSDEDYLVTHPSVALSLESAPLGAFAEGKRTFFLSSQGYYTEWIRPDWIRSANPPKKFRPSGETIVRLMEQWLEEKDAFQSKFFDTRIPVR
ncbi:MAG: hypothetical protein F4Y90_09855 [Rhodothermaceae bacterium]|nr:hypothetical protein [Rhodothermaceae bacterium]MYF39507.1 hypothetical protein [Rhodothermaceae bacterium]